MKKNIYTLICSALFSSAIFSQNAIPNGNFESWTTQNYDVPSGYTGSNPGTFFRCFTPFNCIKTTDSYHGSYALQLTTYGGVSDTCMGYIVNSPNPGGNNPCTWPGGLAFNQTPTGLRGYYKSNVAAGDSASIIIGFRSGSTCLGFYMKKFGGTQNTYTPFTISFNPPIAGTPDTMIFAALSSDVFNNIQKNGSMIQLDSLSFTGIATQPAGFNGDFENWLTIAADKPNNWYINTDDQGHGFNKTTDKQAGNYAMELKTFMGDNKGGNYLARGGNVSTGYYLRNCNGPNCQRGGYPFTNQVDTLCFYYKYAPSSTDTAEAWINFKYAGNNVWGGGTRIYTPASTYQYKEFPFMVGSSIDTVIVGFQSSSWRDTTLNFLGSDFKIDEVHFKSQGINTGIKTYDASVGMKVYPNPSNDGNFVVSNVQYYDLVRVMNMYGQEVNADIKKQNGIALIHIETPGAYIVFVNSRGVITTLKILAGKQ